MNLRNAKKIIPQPVINQTKHLPTAIAANIKFGFPSKSLKIIGVTGTDGKTTTTNMIYKILHDAGKRVSMVSTINAVIGDKKYDTGFHVTSPDSFMIQKLLQEAKLAKSEYVVLEVTSHALDQHRFFGINFLCGVITNITHEHLDYHKTFENYVETKAKLIKHAKLAVLNYDDPSFKLLTHRTEGKVVSFGLNKSADYNPKNFPVKLKILGEYNLYNGLAAVAVAEYLGIEREIILKSLSNFESLEGRMQKIKNRKGIKVVVDFAHTPNALENALKNLRSVTKGKLIAVFGCAAERDTGKRPLMGQVSARLADITVLTDEDPRFEDRMKIIEEITKGAETVKERKIELGVNLFQEPDRMKAIKLAVKLAKRGDTIGIFGKGHEKSMNYRGVEKPWSDVKAATRIING